MVCSLGRGRFQTTADLDDLFLSGLTRIARAPVTTRDARSCWSSSEDAVNKPDRDRSPDGRG